MLVVRLFFVENRLSLQQGNFLVVSFLQLEVKIVFVRVEFLIKDGGSLLGFENFFEQKGKNIVLKGRDLVFSLSYFNLLVFFI